MLPQSLLRSLLVAFLALTGLAQAATPTNVVISQLYGGGGGSSTSTTYTYNTDYLELFNPTSATLTLNNYSVQYASAAGTTISTVTTLPASITLAPGQYYLIGGVASSAGGTLTPTPDAPNTSIAFSATAGKVYLVNSTNRLTSVCPATDPSIVDFIGFGTTASCAFGSPAPAPSATTADIRTNACNVTGNSATEYTASTPAPHNSASPLAPCSGTPSGSPLAATGMATPASINTGDTTLLTVQVTPATTPASTGITVTADLTAIGGSSTQQFFDDGTHGDVAANDNTFSFSTTSTAAGTFSLPATTMDTQARTAPATIALTAVAPPAFASIRAIQASKPSTFSSQKVTTSGIVVLIKSNGFYLEAKDADTNPTTPEGILVYSGSTTLPASIVLGNEIQVSGTVNTYPTTSLTPGTEIDSPSSYTILSSGNPLPAPIQITSTLDSPTGGIKQFAKYEGMRVAIASLTTTSGTGASLTETTETNTSNGRFYGVVTGVPRPFREPGISVTDTLFGAVPPTVPLWDSNPELLYIDSLVSGGPAIDVTSNATVTGISGVMDFSFGSPELILDKLNRPTVTGLMTAQPVPAQAPNEFTVASFNMERFYNDVADADNPGSSAVTVTTAAYQRRLAKASLAVRNVLLMPDIVGCQEIENLAVLTDLANKISADAQAAGQVDPVYTPYLFLATDGTAINTGFLVKSTRVDTLKIEQFGLATTFTNSTGAQAVLNDRTPLVLHAGIKRVTGQPDYNVTVISVHQRSLINVDDPTNTGKTVRLKREAQSEYLANLIQGYQASGEHVITVGDFNSFEFSDGFVDTLGVVRGNPVPAAQVITPPTAGIATPNLVDLVTLLPAAQRQSYVEVGSAQVLDHIVVTPDLVPTETRLVYAHIDSDFPLVDENDATTPYRVSDHDPAVAYFTVPGLPAPILSLSAMTLTFPVQLVTTTSAAMTVTLTNTGNAPLTNLVTLTRLGTGFAPAPASTTCGSTLAAGASCTLGVTFAPTAVGAATSTISISSNASTTPTVVTLNGTGGDFTVAPATPSITVVSGNSAAFPLTLTPLGGYTGPVTFTCSTLALGETCNTSTTTLAATGTTTATVTISTTSQTTISSLTHTTGGIQLAAVGLGSLSLLSLASLLRRRRTLVTLRRSALLTLCFCAGLALTLGNTGCNGSPNTVHPNPNGTPSGTQTITLTATSAGVSHTATVTLIVQ